MTKVEQVTVFKTTDGTVFDQIEPAKKHQAMLNLQKLMKDYKGDRPGGIGIAGIFDLMDNHSDLFRAYLTGGGDGN